MVEVVDFRRRIAERERVSRPCRAWRKNEPKGLGSAQHVSPVGHALRVLKFAYMVIFLLRETELSEGRTNRVDASAEALYNPHERNAHPRAAKL